MNNQPNNQPNDNQNQNQHPDIRSNAPGRIPESLINAAIDGELNEDIQREIAHALQYDPNRKQELLDTADAINALQMPIDTPDFADAILTRADRHRRFIPATWRKHVRAGRMGIAAALLMTLMTVAGLQRLYPRLTTLASHPTPVLNVEQAMEQDAEAFATNLSNEVRQIHASVANPIVGLLKAPGDRNYNFEISLASTAPSSASQSSMTSTFSGSYAAKIQFYSPGHTLMGLYSINRQDAQSRQTQSPVYLYASNDLGSWVYRTPSNDQATDRTTDHASIELDVPALP